VSTPGVDHGAQQALGEDGDLVAATSPRSTNSTKPGHGGARELQPPPGVRGGEGALVRAGGHVPTVAMTPTSRPR
jgi:hypothetical protein